MQPKFYQVGGSIRDKFMERPSNDIDWVVVGATPEWMLAQGYKQVGAEFPVFLSEDGTEYALARTEKKVRAGYHGFETNHDPTVTIVDDLSRRDLTMNAMAFDHETNEFIDPFNGRADIKNYLLRHVSEAFREDPVRVLRLARFNAQFTSNWNVANATKELCKEMAISGELKSLTKERIWKEFEKALNVHTFSVFIFFKVLKEVNALSVIFPLFDKHYDALKQIFKDVHGDITIKKSSPQANFALLMTMFNPKTVEKFCKDYKIPNEYKDYAMFHSKLARKVNMQHFRSPRMLVEMLNAYGIYRGNHFMLDLPWATPYASILKSAYMKTKDVGFKDLTPEQQTTLKGKEITAAINFLREKIL